MLSLIKRLIIPIPQQLDEADARLALSALLVRLARADHQYYMVEAAEITRILMERYSLDHQSAEELRSEAEAVEAEAPDTVRFTRAIKDAVAFNFAPKWSRLCGRLFCLTAVATTAKTA